MLPALAVGLQWDDYLHRSWLTPPTLSVATMHLFSFLDGDPAHIRAQMQQGTVPWWTAPDGKNTFWRPISGLTHWLDYRLWPHTPWLMHLHSLVWWALALSAVAWLYRRLLPSPMLALLATTLFAVDEAHGYAVAWIANRNVLLAMAGGALSLGLHHRWRSGGGPRWGLGAAAALLCAVLSAEAALGTVGYLVAYTLCWERGPVRRRLMGLLPALSVVVVWRIVYKRLGYGAWNTSYLDPLTEPWRSAQAVIERGPVLLLAQWSPLPADAYPLAAAELRRAWWLLALLALLALAALFAPLLGRERRARFWAVGMLLSLVPVCGALPANRLLFFPGLGAAALLAHWFAWAHPRLHRPLIRKAAHGLAAVHLIVAPLVLPLAAASGAVFTRIEPSLATLPFDAAWPQQSAIFVQVPMFWRVGYLPSISSVEGQPLPRSLRFIGSGLAAITLHRPDAHTLEIAPDGGFLAGYDAVFRATPLRLGERIALGDCSVTVLALLSDGRPARIAMRWPTPLEDASLRWLTARNGRYVPFTPPSVGTTVRVAAVEL